MQTGGGSRYRTRICSDDCLVTDFIGFSGFSVEGRRERHFAIQFLDTFCGFQLENVQIAAKIVPERPAVLAVSKNGLVSRANAASGFAEHAPHSWLQRFSKEHFHISGCPALAFKPGVCAGTNDTRIIE